jgi:hypothetical protein
MTTPLEPTVGLGRFIRESIFIVPTHQRDYSWTHEYVNAFLRDIEEAKKNKAQIYFCGLMVFTRTDSQAVKVLDGQQRLATTLMIFSAIRNWMRQQNFTSDEVKISTQLLTTDDIGAPKPEPKLTLTPANNEMFQKYITQPAHISEIEKAAKDMDREDRSKVLLRAALIVNKHIDSKAGEYSTTEEARNYFNELIAYIRDTVSIVRFVLSDDDAAYTIFETLNDRGLALSPLDLVKNYLFSRAERYRVGSLKELEGRWAEMIALLGSDQADSFLRAFWTSRHGVMDGSKLFAAFKKQYDTPEKTHDIGIEMRDAAEHFAALLNSSDPTWANFSYEAKKSVEAISIIGSTQMHPIILAAIKKFERTEVEKLLRILEVIAVRFQLVRKGRPGRIESLGGRAAREIWEGKLKKTSDVLPVISELNISDEDFKSRFQIHSEREGKKARYLLAGIERQSLMREGATFKDELIPGNVTLEHIFPKKPDSYWMGRINNDPKAANDVIHRLGNMCLLTDVNRAIGNKEWSEKLATFQKSRLNIANKLTQYKEWGPDQINERQKHMAELAVAAWRFP